MLSSDFWAVYVSLLVILHVIPKCCIINTTDWQQHLLATRACVRVLQKKTSNPAACVHQVTTTTSHIHIHYYNREYATAAAAT